MRLNHNEEKQTLITESIIMKKAINSSLSEGLLTYKARLLRLVIATIRTNNVELFNHKRIFMKFIMTTAKNWTRVAFCALAITTSYAHSSETSVAIIKSTGSFINKVEQ